MKIAQNDGRANTFISNLGIWKRFSWMGKNTGEFSYKAFKTQNTHTHTSLKGLSGEG